MMKKYFVLMVITLMLISIFPTNVLAQQESAEEPRAQPFHRLVFHGSPSPAGQAAAMVYALVRLIRIGEDESVISTPMVTNAMKKSLEQPQVNFAAVVEGETPIPENPCYLEYEGDTIVSGLEPGTGPYEVERPEGEPLLIGEYNSDDAGNIMLEQYTGPYPVVVEGIATCKAPLEEAPEEIPEEEYPPEEPELEFPEPEEPTVEDKWAELCSNDKKDSGEIGVDCGGVCDTICDPEKTGIPTTNVKPAPEWTEIPLTLDIMCIDTGEYVAGDYDITVVKLDKDLFKVAVEKNGKFMELPQSVTLKGGKAKEPFTLGVQCLAPPDKVSYPLELKMEVIDYEDCPGKVKDPVSYVTVQLVPECKQQCCPTGFYWDTYEKKCVMQGCDIRCPDEYFLSKYCACISKDCSLECPAGEMLKQTAGQDCECVDIPADYPKWTTPPATCPTTAASPTPAPPAPTPAPTPGVAPTPTTCTEEKSCGPWTYWVGAPLCSCSRCYMCTIPSWATEGGIGSGVMPSSVICMYVEKYGKCLQFPDACAASCKQSGQKIGMPAYTRGACGASAGGGGMTIPSAGTPTDPCANAPRVSASQMMSPGYYPKGY
jgi:hypothetical protein